MDPKAPYAECDKCPFAESECVKSFGASPEAAKAVVVGESPGFHEARFGKPFIGKSGQLLRVMLKQAGFRVPQVPPSHRLRQPIVDALERGDVLFTNAALCLPKGSDVETFKTSKAKFKAATCCRKRLLAELKPYLDAGVPIMVLGGASLYVLTGRTEVGKYRSRWHHKGRVLSSWHPAYILRTPIRFGDLYRDVQKLYRGGPLHNVMDPVTHVVIDDELTMRVFTDGLIAMAQGGHIADCTCSIDIETGNVDWIRDEFICISISTSPRSSFVIGKSIIRTECVRECLTRLFDSCIKWTGHNFKFDMRFIRYQLGVPNVRVDYDSLIADYALDENRRHALKDLLTEFYDVPDYEAGLVQKYLKSKNDMYTKVPLQDMYKYAALDTAYQLYLWHDLKRQLEEDGLFERPFMYPLMASQPPYLELELRGVLVDRESLDTLSKQFRKHLDVMRERMERMAGLEFNPNSWMQVGHIMYDIYDMPHFKARFVKNDRSTAKPIREQIMHHYAEQGFDVDSYAPYQWISMYHQWKQIEKLRSSYVDNMFPHIGPDGRVHPDVLMYGTETGRPSVRNPALQTIPRTGSGEAMGEVWGKRIKQVFIAPPGSKIVQVDYSQAELRTAAWMSKDPFLTDVYENDRDIHAEVAEAYWPGWGEMLPGDTRAVGSANYDKKTLRIEAKKCVFARLYLGTEHAISGILGIPPKAARRYLVILDQLLGGLVSWEHSQFETLRKQGYVEAITGRRRRFPLITRENSDDAKKAACNAPIQAAASDLTLMSFIATDAWIRDEGIPNTYPLITVHDSILLEVPNTYVDWVSTSVKNMMERIASSWMPGIPWKADIEVGQSWGDIQPVD